MSDNDILNEITDDQVDRAILSRVTAAFCRANAVLPLRQENGHLLGAVAEPSGLLPLSEIAAALNLPPRALTTSRGAILAAINRLFSENVGSEAQSLVDELKTEDLESLATEWEKPRDLMELTEEGPVIRLLNSILFEAVKERASDIHVEPYEKSLEIRFRVDGVLRKVLNPPKIIQESLISRIKIMARLDIAEKRLAQDGRIRLLVGGRDIDLRVSIIPTTHGERGVLRLLDRRQGILGFDQIGMDEADIRTMEGLLEKPNGILLVTGPTGSGKSTTLYAGLNRLKSEERNIITIEDPVEYQLPGVGQIQVNPRIGLTFAQGLRSILRQDPDVIMVGEIRDGETAEIAIHASLTGHLVLSTLHTNSAAGAVTRLLDMGIEPFLVASSVAAVIGQRLVRHICPDCREAIVPPPDIARHFPTGSAPSRIFRGAGCDRCRGNGYVGRFGIFEMFRISPQIRRLILQRADTGEIEEAARREGFRTMFENALARVVEGATTMTEVLRVAHATHADLPL